MPACFAACPALCKSLPAPADTDAQRPCSARGRAWCGGPSRDGAGRRAGQRRTWLTRVASDRLVSLSLRIWIKSVSHTVYLAWMPVKVTSFWYLSRSSAHAHGLRSEEPWECPEGWWWSQPELAGHVEARRDVAARAHRLRKHAHEPERLVDGGGRHRLGNGLQGTATNLGARQDPAAVRVCVSGRKADVRRGELPSQKRRLSMGPCVQSPGTTSARPRCESGPAPYTAVCLRARPAPYRPPSAGVAWRTASRATYAATCVRACTRATRHSLLSQRCARGGWGP